MSNVQSDKYHKIEWRPGLGQPWVSRKYFKESTGDITHDLRCDICGKWYNYSLKDIERINREGRWNKQKNRPYHCNSEHCQEWHRRRCAHLWKVATDIAKIARPTLFMGVK